VTIDTRFDFFCSAKHLRAKDRALNNHVYPKIHYPEVYILEGGYCQYFKHSAPRCQPSGYVSMDDPNHVESRKEDLDQFRKIKFGRYKSYAYGEGPFKPSASSQQQQQQQLQKRNTAPSAGANSLFAAANAARTRRGGGLAMLAEDANSNAHSEDEETDIGDSPCPPPTKTAVFKGKKIGRAPLARAETYGPNRMAH
jgi:M-phase inducer tyrosine phosphatase